MTVLIETGPAGTVSRGMVSYRIVFSCMDLLYKILQVLLS